LLALVLFTCILFILASSSTRIGPRLSSLFNHFRPTYTKGFRPITNSTMAPKQYKTPPQAPPLFTATKESLLEDAKKLCEGTRGLLDKVSSSFAFRDVKRFEVKRGNS
jgi:metallopeptidase MepB